MSYATLAQLRAEMALLPDVDMPDDDATLQLMLDAAQRDLDDYFRWTPPGPDDPPRTTRLPFSELGSFAQGALQRANVLQTLYIEIIGGREEMIEGKPRFQAAGPVTFSRDAPDPISGAALVCLAGVWQPFWTNKSGCADPPPVPPLAA